MNIAMVSSEVFPFSKTGGLADVSYALSAEYVKKGESVLIVTPLYSSIKFAKNQKLTKVFEYDVKMNWRSKRCEVYHLLYKGIEFFFLHNEYYFSRPGQLYGYYDDGERFAFFQLAAIELLKVLPFKVDICHVHDWQGGMIPCILKNKYQNDKDLKNVRTVLTIHNPLFKGYLAKDSLYDLFNLPTSLYDDGSVRFDDQVSTLKAGIKFSDKITTVSPTHAYELTTVEGSKGLWYDLILRQNDFVGILNGMDYTAFDPKKDKTIYKNYSIKDYKVNKKENKIMFCQEYNLDPELPLFAVVSRLTDQKGLDLIYAMADFVTHENGNFGIIGSGERYAEDMFNNLYARNPSHNFVYIGYNEELAHKLYAASDFFIMPSAFEPCGLGQMIAQRYGSLPIVRRTGGLKDSVICYDSERKNDDIANGFGFDEYSITEALKCVAQAVTCYHYKKDVMDNLVKNAIKTDHSWNESAEEYLKLYRICLSYNQKD